MHPPLGRLLAVNVVAELHPNRGARPDVTAIDKRPVDGPVSVGPLGLDGDRQMNTRHHGGRDQALYACAREDVEPWEAEVGHVITPGWFGENLTTVGVDVSEALVGEQWQIGGDRPDAVVVEATIPRTPCGTFARWTRQPRWVTRFSAYGRVGTYLRVVETGTVRAGDPVEVIRRPDHGVTVGQVLRGLDPSAAHALLGAHETGAVELAPKLLHAATRLTEPR